MYSTDLWTMEFLFFFLLVISFFLFFNSNAYASYEGKVLYRCAWLTIKSSNKRRWMNKCRGKTYVGNRKGTCASTYERASNKEKIITI